VGCTKTTPTLKVFFYVELHIGVFNVPTIKNLRIGWILEQPPIPISKFITNSKRVQKNINQMGLDVASSCP